MAKIICDYCDFGTSNKLCYKGGMKECQGELFMCKQKAYTGENNALLPYVRRMCLKTKKMREYYNEFRNEDECLSFIETLQLTEEQIIDRRQVTDNVYCMWHYA